MPEVQPEREKDTADLQERHPGPGDGRKGCQDSPPPQVDRLQMLSPAPTPSLLEQDADSGTHNTQTGKSETAPRGRPLHQHPHPGQGSPPSDRHCMRSWGRGSKD